MWIYVTSRLDEDDAWQVVVDSLATLRALGHVVGQGGYRGRAKWHGGRHGAYWVEIFSPDDEPIPYELIKETRDNE